MTRRVRWIARVGVVGVLAAAFFSLPVVRPGGPTSRILVDREGRLLAARVAADEQWRMPPGVDLPERYVQALLTFEDRRFFRHPGIDPIAVVRAVAANVRKGRVVSGASTITMQVIRMGRSPTARTIWQKAWEALLAVRLEAALSKREILATYAAHAPFGGNVVGLEAAVWRYLGRPSKTLTWAEAAFLAVLPNSPSLMHPGRRRSQLKAKRDRLLFQLRKAKIINDIDYTLAMAEPLPRRPQAMPQHALHWLARQSATSSDAWTPTTLDRTVQARAEDEVRHALEALKGDGIHNASAVVMHVPSGETLAYVGNGVGLQAVEHAPFVDVARAPRSTGSILKPFLYAYALDAGELNPAERMVDAPIRVGTFFPENFDGSFRGVVRADTALARSLNVPAVLLLKRVGVARFLGFLRSSGLSTLGRSARHYGLSLALGGAEATLWELTSLYAGLSWRAAGNSGPWPGPRSGLGPTPSIQPKLSVGAAYLTLSALQEVTRPGLRRRWRRLAGNQSIYWKTGTSFGFRDAWAIGVTGSYAVGVWVGNADGEGRPGLVGLRAAAPLMFALFDQLPRSPPLTEPSDALVAIEVCKHSGHRPGPHCGDRSIVTIPKDSTYATVCPFCRSFSTDARGQRRVHADCHPFEEIRSRRQFVLPAQLERHYRQHDAGYRSLPVWKEGCAPSGGTVASMSCIFPPPDAQFYVPRQLDGRRGRLVFEAAHRDPEAEVHWHLDDRFLTTTQEQHQVEVNPQPGEHRLTLVDYKGERIQRRFVVLPRAEDSAVPAAGAGLSRGP